MEIRLLKAGFESLLLKPTVKAYWALSGPKKVPPTEGKNIAPDSNYSSLMEL